MLVSIKDLNFTYIGKTMSIRNRIQRHNSGVLSVSIEPLHLWPYALFAYICGFDSKMIYYSTFKDYGNKGEISAFYICHSINCKKGVLFTARHNDLHDGVADLAGKSFTPMHVCDNLLILAGCIVQRTNAQPDGSTHPSSKIRHRPRNRKATL